jgi:hypothetical protein
MSTATIEAQFFAPDIGLASLVKGLVESPECQWNRLSIGTQDTTREPASSEELVGVVKELECSAPGCFVSIEICMGASSFTIYAKHKEIKVALKELEIIKLPQVGRPFIRVFSSCNAYYAFACSYEELFAWNLFKYDLWGNGNMSTSKIGSDPHRYVPGIYWLNFFSRRMIEDLSLDVQRIATATDCDVEELENGVILELVEHPELWPQKRETVQALISSDDRFFDLSAVPPPQDGISPRDFVAFLTKLSDQWP